MEKNKKWLVSSLINAFEKHLLSCHGVSKASCKVYCQYVRQFLNAQYNTPAIDLTEIQPLDLISFVTERSHRYKPKTSKLLATSLRNFIRFLQLNGLCDAQLCDAVPAPHYWRFSDLPGSLSDEQVKVLLASFDRSSAVGRRGYAMALCMIELGLRADEVARISLDHIDWREGTLRIPTSKSRRANILPLPTGVGQAFVAYLSNGRPFTQERQIFLRHISPIGKPINSSAVRAIIRRAFKRAKINTPSKGTQILRHTAATRMICKGATLKEIADVLGHRHIDTTAIYAKVNLPALTEVAMPWPEV